MFFLSDGGKSPIPQEGRMSSFMVTGTHINHVIAGLRMLPNADDLFGGKVTTKRGAAALGRKLWQMNADAVNARYRENNDAPWFNYVELPTDASRAEQLERHKAIRCLIYQCAEGSVPETELFKSLVSACDALALTIYAGIYGKTKVTADRANKILADLPDWESAPWGHYDAPAPTKTPRKRPARKPAATKLHNAGFDAWRDEDGFAYGAI